MRDLNAIDPIPTKLGAKVEAPKPLTEAQEKQELELIFEFVPHNFSWADGKCHRIVEADCQQKPYSLGVWPFPTQSAVIASVTFELIP